MSYIKMNNTQEVLENMKRILAALVCVIMVCASFTSCAKRDDNDMGPIFNAYVGGEPYNLDPQIDHTDDDAVMIMSLIFEGLTNVNAKGKVENALLDKYTYTKDEIKGEYTLTMSIKETTWTDSRRVSADDFVYSWKRLLSSDFSSSAASLLFDVKNAVEAKRGDVSVDDVGLAAVDTYTIQVIFEQDIDVDQFLRKCASIALVPLREDVVTKSPNSWSKKSTSMVANGPFAVKGLDYEKGEMRLERNAYYFLGEDDDLLKYVIPYRIFITFLKDDASLLEGSDKAPESLAAQLQSYIDGNIKLITDLPLSERENYKKDGMLADSASTLSVVIDNENPLFSDAKVRQALSYAIDRNEIVNIIKYSKAATGLINYTCFDGSTNKKFRDQAGAILSTSADTGKASALLAEAGVSGGTFTLTYRQTEEDEAVAKYLQTQWQSIGFTVELQPVLATKYVETDKATQKDNTYYNDVLSNKYNTGDYDVILIDYSMISVDPFAALAQFATAYSGNACDAKNDWAIVGNMCGFNNETYNAIIDRAFAEKDTNKRASILKEAEQLLLQEMPIIPLAFNQNFCLSIKDIKGQSFDFTGNVDLKRVTLKDYLNYYPTED